MHLRSRIEIVGANPFVLVSAGEASRLKQDWRRSMPVTFRVDERADDIAGVNLMPVGDGSFRLYLNGEIRRATEVGVGDVVTLDVEFDHGSGAVRCTRCHPEFRQRAGPEPTRKAGGNASAQAGRRKSCATSLG